jgi:CheY-like chemotaxis protein
VRRVKMMYEPDARPDNGGRDGSACLRVLVVDDAPDVTELLALMMTHAGYEVSMAFSAAEAFDAARSGRFDAVISDIGMPGMNGYQLAEALRALPGYESTPLIAVTGFTHLEDRERARRAGFDALSLSVAKDSPAVSLYERYGFRAARASTTSSTSPSPPPTSSTPSAASAGE